MVDDRAAVTSSSGMEETRMFRELLSAIMAEVGFCAWVRHSGQNPMPALSYREWYGAYVLEVSRG